MLLLLISICFIGQAWAQQANLNAGVDRTQVAVGEQFTLTFEANGRMKNFQAPDLSAFRVLSGPNQSTQQSWINGKSSFIVTLSYVLSPKKPGTITIPSAAANIGGKKVVSTPIQIKVTKERERSNDPNDPYAIAERNVFIKPVLSKKKLVVGESVTLSYKLYYAMDIQKPSANPPKLTGFYADELDLGRVTSNKREQLNGKLYNVAILKKYVLIPQRSGEFELDPFSMEMEVGIPTNQRDFFGRPVNNYIRYTAKSQPFSVTVEALPTSNLSDNFSGAVGDLKLNVQLSPTKLEANASATLKIEVSGTGNLKLFELPEAEIPSSIEVYDPKINESISVNSRGQNGKRSAEYLLVPRYGGNYKIPEIKFTYFDLRTDAYKTLSAGPFELKVSGEEMSEANSGSRGITQPGSKEDINYLDQDILFIKTEAGDLEQENSTFAATTPFYILSSLPPLSFLLMLLLARNRRREEGDVKGVRSRKAGLVAKKQLTAARKLRDEKKDIEFFAQIQRTLLEYIGDKSKLSQTELDKKGLKNVFLEHRVDEEVAAVLEQLYDECGFARYAPGDASTKMDEIYQKAEALITKTESQWV